MYYPNRSVVGCPPGYGPLARTNVTTGALSTQWESLKAFGAKDSLGLGVSNQTIGGLAVAAGLIWYGAEAGWFR